MDALPRLLVELSEAATLAHTEVTLVDAMAAALGRHVALRSLELVSVDGDSLTVLRHPDGTRRRRERRASVVAGVTTAAARGCDGEAAECVEARTLGATALWVLPLAEGRWAVAAVGEAPAWADGEALRAVARVMAVGFEHVAVLTRVADVSRRAHHDRRALRDELVRRVGGDGPSLPSAAMRRLLEETVPAVARYAVTVLVRGESGVGKDVVTRRIHALSPRASRPLLAVNCAALPENLVESVLFGHERGAFTGAVERHLGYFERAHGGTLQLDEVGELSPTAQARLLRVLQSGEFERVGGAATLRADVRVVAVTHRDLAAMVEAGTFRFDLYHRLRAVELVVPPLRERPEDVLPLAVHFTERVGREHGVAPRRFTDAEVAALRGCAWPGNVRELEQAVMRATLFPEMGYGVERMESAKVPARGAGAAVATLDDAMREHIERALRATEGRVYGADGAARLLGVKPTTLQSRMKKLGVRR
jgi:transcriptional regulator with GAF, ATPase, and Fis domain